jgi:hypothetical protein
MYAFHLLSNFPQRSSPNTGQVGSHSDDLAHASFCPEGFIGIGVPIGSDAFVQSFVAKKCRDIIDDVEKLDDIQDGFIHFQLIRFCQSTRIQYVNSHIMFGNRDPVCSRHINLSVCSLPLHRHSYIGFIFSFRFIDS